MWKQVLVLSTLGVVSQLQGSVLYAAAPSDRGSYHTGGQRGTYNYGYNTGDGIAKVEVRRDDGSVVGSYRYFDANGKQVVRSYIADERGFRVLGNDLPISPNTPAAAIEGLPAFTAAVEGDTLQTYQNIGSVQSTQITQPQPSVSSITDKHQALIKQQESLIRKQQRQLEKLQRQYSAFKNQITQTKKQSNRFTPTKPLYTRPVPNAVSQYLLLPNRIDYDFPAGFAVQGQQVIKAPVGVKGEHSFMADYAAGHAPSAGHLHDPVGPHIEEVIHPENEVAAGHTKNRRRHYIIGHAK